MGKYLAHILLVTVFLSACGSDSDDDSNTTPGNTNGSSNSAPSYTSKSANISIFGIDTDQVNLQEVSLGDGKQAVSLDDATSGYAAFGIDAGDEASLNSNASSSQASVYKNSVAKRDSLQAASSTESDEVTIRSIAEILLEQHEQALRNEGIVDRFDIVINQVSRNSQALVVNYTVDLILAADQTTSSLRNVLLAGFDSTGTVGAPSDVTTSGSTYRLTMAVWSTAGRVISWTSLFLESNNGLVQQLYSDLNRGTVVTDASELMISDATNDFSQTAGNSSADILWVIDNSGSMGEEQDNLANGADLFFNKLQATSLDYHLGVVRTGSQQLPCWELAKLSDDSSRYISPSTANSQTEWQLISRPGTSGSPNETGFFCGQQAYLDPTGSNTGFDRANAVDIMVFVSDEPENESYWGSDPSGIDGSHPGYTSKGLDEYLAYFSSKPVTAFGLVGTATSPRASLQNPRPNEADTTYSCEGEGGSATGGANYGEVISQTGGSRTSICSKFSSWETTFQGVVDAASGRASSFRLSEVPIASTVVVTMGGIKTTRDVTHQDGFDVIYDTQGASIVFYGPSIPNEGQMIQVKYSYLENS